jgi:hypothetical protein
MASKNDNRKKSSSSASTLRNVVGGVGAEGLIDLVEKLGLVDLVVGRIKSRIEETDLDELMEDIADYLKRNPDVLVVGLAAVTVATGVVVYLNSRREWDGRDRRNYEIDEEEVEVPARVTKSTGRVRKTSPAS